MGAKPDNSRPGPQTRQRGGCEAPTDGGVEREDRGEELKWLFERGWLGQLRRVPPFEDAWQQQKATGFLFVGTALQGNHGF